MARLTKESVRPSFPFTLCSLPVKSQPICWLMRAPIFTVKAAKQGAERARAKPMARAMAHIFFHRRLLITGNTAHLIQANRMATARSTGCATPG